MSNSTALLYCFSYRNIPMKKYIHLFVTADIKTRTQDMHGPPFESFLPNYLSLTHRQANTNQLELCQQILMPATLTSAPHQIPHQSLFTITM